VRITTHQAATAALMILDIAQKAGDGAVELRLAPEVVDEIRALAREIQQNPEREAP
jgi:hypothetical protein